MYGINHVSLDAVNILNFNVGFSTQKSDILMHLSQWQYWWWFWFSFFWTFYYFIILRTIKNRMTKMNLKFNTSLRGRGKWGDFLIAFVPLSWCGNILLNSNFILRIIEWQNESSLFTVRIHGKQWYWVYKFDLSDAVSIMTAPKNIGMNRWVVGTPLDITVTESYLQSIQLRTQADWIKNYWSFLYDKDLKSMLSTDFLALSVKNQSISQLVTAQRSPLILQLVEFPLLLNNLKTQEEGLLNFWTTTPHFDDLGSPYHQNHNVVAVAIDSLRNALKSFCLDLPKKELKDHYEASSRGVFENSLFNTNFFAYPFDYLVNSNIGLLLPDLITPPITVVDKTSFTSDIQPLATSKIFSPESQEFSLNCDFDTDENSVEINEIVDLFDEVIMLIQSGAVDDEIHQLIDTNITFDEMVIALNENANNDTSGDEFLSLNPENTNNAVSNHADLLLNSESTADVIPSNAPLFLDSENTNNGTSSDTTTILNSDININSYDDATALQQISLTPENSFKKDIANDALNTTQMAPTTGLDLLNNDDDVNALQQMVLTLENSFRKVLANDVLNTTQMVPANSLDLLNNDDDVNALQQMILTLETSFDKVFANDTLNITQMVPGTSLDLLNNDADVNALQQMGLTLENSFDKVFANDTLNITQTVPGTSLDLLNNDDDVTALQQMVLTLENSFKKVLANDMLNTTQMAPTTSLDLLNTDNDHSVLQQMGLTLENSFKKALANDMLNTTQMVPPTSLDLLNNDDDVNALQQMVLTLENSLKRVLANDVLNTTQMVPAISLDLLNNEVHTDVNTANQGPLQLSETSTHALNTNVLNTNATLLPHSYEFSEPTFDLSHEVSEGPALSSELMALSFYDAAQLHSGLDYPISMDADASHLMYLFSPSWYYKHSQVTSALDNIMAPYIQFTGYSSIIDLLFFENFKEIITHKNNSTLHSQLFNPTALELAVKDTGVADVNNSLQSNPYIEESTTTSQPALLHVTDDLDADLSGTTIDSNEANHTPIYPFYNFLKDINININVPNDVGVYDSTNHHYDYPELDDEWDIEHNIKRSSPVGAVRLLKHLITHENKQNVLKLQFFDDSSDLVNKLPDNNNNFWVLKQKRYKKKQAIKNKLMGKELVNTLSEVKDPNTIQFYSSRVLINSQIFENTHDIVDPEFTLDPYTAYKCIRNNRKRSELLPVSLCRRLLRTKRTLVLPTHVNITIVTNSYDVVHSWFVPGLGIKMDCVPGRSTHHSLYLDNTGFYYGQCAEICGRYHHHMPIRLCAVPFELFVYWWHIKGLPRLLQLKKTKLVSANYGILKYRW